MLKYPTGLKRIKESAIMKYLTEHDLMMYGVEHLEQACARMIHEEPEHYTDEDRASIYETLIQARALVNAVPLEFDSVKTNGPSDRQLDDAERARDMATQQREGW